MTAFMALIVREWRELRTVLMVLGALYLLAMGGSIVAMHKGAAYVEGTAQRQAETYDDAEEYDDDFDFFDDDDDWGWASPWELREAISAELILFVYAHSMRGSAVLINLTMLLLAMFYLIDALYKERSDGSTYFYRSLPVQDHILLLSKLAAGTVGILLLSYLMGLLSVGISRIALPGVFKEILAASGQSLSQIAYGDFFRDWLMYHILLLIWLAPYASYLLLVSAVTRGRPLLAALGLPIVMAVLVRYFLQSDLLINVFTTNFIEVGKALVHEWEGNRYFFIEPDETVKLFRGFGRYIWSSRSLVSLAVAAVFSYGTWAAYRRNMATS